MIPLEIFRLTPRAFSPCSLDSRARPWEKHIRTPLLSSEIQALCILTGFLCTAYIASNILAPWATFSVLVLCYITQRPFICSQLWCLVSLCCYDQVFTCAGDILLCLCPHGGYLSSFKYPITNFQQQIIIYIKKKKSMCRTSDRTFVVTVTPLFWSIGAWSMTPREYIQIANKMEMGRLKKDWDSRGECAKTGTGV